jgi:copper/silver efflux system protein
MEVGPAVFFSLLLIAVAVLPVFTLVDQEGRLFKPLAWTKNLTMLAGGAPGPHPRPRAAHALHAHGLGHVPPRWLSWLWNQVTVGRYYPEEHHPVSRVLFRRLRAGVPLRDPALAEGDDRWPRSLVMLATVPVYLRLGHEFMPPLNEGTILYMPTTLPGISVTEASRLLQVQDRILKGFPEVESVHGKAGRAETSTDPAPSR